MDWIAILLALWLTIGFIPAVVLMFARARQTYYVDPWRPLIGALQGPWSLWQTYHALRHGRYGRPRRT